MKRRAVATIGLILLASLCSAIDWAAVFEACRTAPGVAVLPGCEEQDADGDGDADQVDFGILQTRPHEEPPVIVYVIEVKADLGMAISPDAYLAEFFAERAKRRVRK